MPASLPSPDRRRLLTLLAGLPLLEGSDSAFAEVPFGRAPPLANRPFPSGTQILVGGPQGGAMDRWARLLRLQLGPAISPGHSMEVKATGGPDGVTGANEFEARTPPDGRSVLLVPGEAALEWLVGDPRTHFDVGHWVTVMAAVTPAVVVGRVAAFASAGIVRLAAAHPAGHALPAVLGIELLGSRAQLMPAAVENGTIEAAFARNAVDAVLLRGHEVPAQVAALVRPGIRPIFSLGSRNELGALIRSPEFPHTPTLPELYTRHRGIAMQEHIYQAWSAAAAACQLEFGLVLPALTPPAMVALWRRGGATAAGTLDVQSAALALSVRVIGGTMATPYTAPLGASRPALVALRTWLRNRFGWQPS